jgi:two-component system phosphate regulon sensor histidine kinase PhoR
VNVRLRAGAAVALVALAAWLAAEWAGAGLSALGRAAIVGGAGLALGALLGARLERRIEQLRSALEAVVAGRSYARLERAARGPFGSLARAIDGADAALRERAAAAGAERARLAAVLDGMVEGVLVLGADGRALLANARLRELFGAWGDVAGRSVLELIRLAEVDDALRHAAESGEPVAREIELAGERCLALQARRFPVHGEPEGTVAVFHDVSEIRRLESHRREFVANVSHELRTPLTAIQGFAETLQNEDLAPERRRQYVEVISRNADRLRALIEDLLDLSRIESGKRLLTLESVAPAPLVASLLRDLRPRVDARKLELAQFGSCPPLRADRRALEDVLVNLLDNAIKYTEPGGHVEVRLSSEGTRGRIDVVDDGIGIPERERMRVFERFYRVDKARSRDLGGTGLGLAIVKHLVQSMGGEVYVAPSETAGTTLRVLLPLASAA